MESSQPLNGERKGRRPTGFWRGQVRAALGRLGGEADVDDVIKEIKRAVDLTKRELTDSYQGRVRCSIPTAFPRVKWHIIPKQKTRRRCRSQIA